MTMSGRPITGMLRLNTQSNQAGKSMENVLKTARTAATARPVTSATGRFVRLGTVSEKKTFEMFISNHLQASDEFRNSLTKFSFRCYHHKYIDN